jgi:curved DNA-binding protein
MKAAEAEARSPRHAQRRRRSGGPEERDPLDYKDYYGALKVKKDASQDDIQKAYRKLARKFHPDVNKSPDSERRFKEIGEAYEVLKDPEKRQKYDQYGAAWKHAQQTGGGVPPGWQGFDFSSAGGGPGGFDFRDLGGSGAGAEGFSSFFEMLFGSAGARARRAPFGDMGSNFGESFGPRPGADAEATLPLTLEEAIRGGAHQFSYVDPVSGERKSVSVRIPAGVRSGQRIRLAGRGLAGSDGGARGDLYLRIEVPPDPRFRVDGNDLYTPLPVAPWEAALGAEAEVETPEGRVRVRVPAGSSTGRKIRLRGHGLPQQGPGPQERGRGDLFAEIKVVVPEKLDERERELFEQLRDTSAFRARPAESGERPS